jgi:hypothetical protein
VIPFIATTDMLTSGCDALSTILFLAAGLIDPLSGVLSIVGALFMLNNGKNLKKAASALIRSDYLREKTDCYRVIRL